METSASFLQICETPVIIELGMESQHFYLGLVVLATFLFVIWFFVGRKGGYGQPTILDLKKGEGLSQKQPILQTDMGFANQDKKMRDVTPQTENLQTPPVPTQPLTPPPQCNFVYNGHDWDAFEVLGVSPFASFSEITKAYQAQIKRADPGKHEFMQTAYMAVLKKY